jgi:ABC-type branched-subunit amino acid transport system ATPase component
MIIGPSGSGKSTLTLQLAAAGWRYLSDDELLLSLSENEVEARSFRRPFAITENTALMTGVTIFENVSRQQQERREVKRCFDPQTIFPGAQIETVKPSFLLFTRVNGEAETRLSELSQAEAMKRLIRACPWATYDKTIAVENLDMLSRLARQSRSFDFSAGADLLNTKRSSDLLKSYVGA